MRIYTLLYQAGIANVFVQSRIGAPHKRVMQGAYRECEGFVKGARHAGATLLVMNVNIAGDAAHWVDSWRAGVGSLWSEGKDRGFVEEFGIGETMLIGNEREVRV